MTNGIIGKIEYTIGPGLSIGVADPRGTGGGQVERV
jgi:hypothetical protein